MYTQCSKCKEFFLGEAHAWNLQGDGYCAGCFNELAYGDPDIVLPKDIPLTIDDYNPPHGLPPLFPPPTMG